MTIKLNANERLDDVQRCGYEIIQNTEIFCFGIDAVLLSAYAKVLPGEKVLDLGCGNGVIPILMKARNAAAPGAHYTGLEIQEINVDMARRSVIHNGIERDVEIVHGDIKEASGIFGGASFDVITTNPPYMNENHGLTNPESHKAIARHEILCTLEDVIRESAKVLRPGGRFYMVHRPHRLTEIIMLMKQYRVEPKRMRFVHPYADKDANMVLIEGIRGARPMVKVENPLIIYSGRNEYTEDLLKIYYT